MIVSLARVVTFTIPWSSVHASSYHADQNHHRSFPAPASKAAKKSHGLGCLKAQSRAYLR
jgi:hypothetical protein